MNHPSRGDLWWVEAPELGRRPFVVMARDAAIANRGRFLMAPCTTTVRGLATEVVLEPGDDPVPQVCAVNLDSVREVSRGFLVQRMGRLSSARMRQVCEALKIAVDCR